MSSSLRRICSSCKQELSRSAYYRHQNTPASCPARQRSELPKKVETESTTCTADIVCVPSCDSEVASVDHVEVNTQSACVDIENEGSVAENEEEIEVILNESFDDASASTSSCSSDEQQRPASQTTNAIVKAVSFFLLFFQLKFRVPDRGITFLLSFLKGILSALMALVPSCQSLILTQQSIPKSL